MNSAITNEAIKVGDWVHVRGLRYQLTKPFDKDDWLAIANGDLDDIRSSSKAEYCGTFKGKVVVIDKANDLLVAESPGGRREAASIGQCSPANPPKPRHDDPDQLRLFEESGRAAVAVVFWLAILLVIFAVPIGYVVKSHFEAAAYNKLTGNEATWWDAMWVELRVQDVPQRKESRDDSR